MGTLSAQNWISGLGLVVSVVTLVYLIKYVRATKGIERASREQSEGLSKPVIFAHSIGWETNLEYVTVVNIGTGPALGVRGVVVEGPGSSTERRFSFKQLFAHVEASEKEKSLVPNGTSGPLKRTVECTYRSISDTEYVSRTAYDEQYAISDFTIQVSDRR